MRFAGPFLAAALLLAGCATPDTATTTSDGAGSPEPEPSVRSFNDTFALNIQPDPELVAIGGVGSTNCVFFWDTDGTDLALVGGNATLTWSATPNTPKFRIRTATTATDAASPSGGSPLHWSFGPLEPDADLGWGIGFWVDYTLADATLPVLQDVDLHLDFDYTGTLPKASRGTCSGGGL